MELIEARALKSSFLSGMAMKANQQLFFDDLWCVTEINSVHTDDFSVDDLLDFSDKDFKDGSFQELREDNEKNTSHGSSSHHRNSQVPMFSGLESLESLSADEIPVPVEELENLEWLSQIVDDSTSEYSLLCPVGSFKNKTESFTVTRPEPVVRKQFFKKTRVPCFPLPVPVKPRTKRCRPAGKTWSLTSPTTSADSSSPSSSSYGSSPFPSFVFPNGDLFCSVEKPAYKKPKKNRSSEFGSTSTGVTTQRRCTHCQVQKTPQWRTGPLGPKTLCNACGVRFKSGRLFPEYRPACSPTFSQESHSNSHRKVLEMRRKREMGDVVDSGPAQSVQTC